MSIERLTRLVLAVGGTALGGALVWRYAARRWQLPCPPAFAWVLESGLREWAAPTALVLERMGLRHGLRVLEVGPGIGYMTVPVALRLGEHGRLVALEIQPQMARMVRERIVEAGLENVEVRQGDVTSSRLEPETYDLAFLVTVLGEIPDRDRAIARLREALKPGGTLSFTEIFGDPHYQFYADLERRCLASGLEPAGRYGSWRAYTANFRRPTGGEPHNRGWRNPQRDRRRGSPVPSSHQPDGRFQWQLAATLCRCIAPSERHPSVHSVCAPGPQVHPCVRIR